MIETTENISASGNYKYWAFISYSHQDKKWGDWLHKTLETYRVPRRLVGKESRDGAVPKRAYPIFRDREELPGSSDLGNNINEALENSRYLIVICSPRSAKSKWVNEEIRAFKAMGREGRVLCLIVDGEPNAADKIDLDEEECFPDAVKFRINTSGQLSDERTEPIAADARQGKDGKANARLKLLAGILGIEYDALKQRDRRRTMVRRVVASILTVVVTGICVLGLQIQHKKEWERLGSESLHLAELSTEQTELGNTKMALQLALEALPADLTDPDRPYVREAEVALSRAIDMHRQLAVYTDVASLESVSFSPDGQKFLSVSDDSVHVWDKETGHMIFDFMDLVHPIARFSKDGNEVMVFDIQNDQPNFFLLDAVTGNIVREKMLGDPSYLGKFFSPDGRYAITYSEENSQTDKKSFALFFWPTGKGDQQPLVLRGLSTPVSKIVFSADASRFMLIESSGEQGDVWQLQETTFIHLQTIKKTLSAVAFDSTGKRVAMALKNGGLEVQDVNTGQVVAQGSENQKFKNLIFTPNGQAILAEGAWNSIKMFDAKTAEEENMFFSGKRVVISADGTRMATVGRQGRLELYDLVTMQQYAVLVGHKEEINDLVFSPVDSRLLLTAAGDHTARLWNTASSRKQIFTGHNGEVQRVIYSTDGAKIASASSDRKVSLWDAVSGQELFVLGGEQTHDYDEIFVAFAANDKTIATSTTKGFGDIGEVFPRTIRWWNSHTGELLFEQGDQVQWLNQPIVSRDSRYALTIGLDRIVRIVDCATANIIHELVGHTANIIHAVFSPDSTRVLTSSHDGTIRLWSVADGKELQQIGQKNQWGEAVGSFVTFSPDGHTFASTNSHQKAIQIFDSADGQLLKKLESTPLIRSRGSQNEYGNVLRFSPDSRYLLSMEEFFADHINLWDIESEKLVAALPGSMMSYDKTLFSPDSELLVVWNNDAEGPVVWSVPTGDRIADLNLPDDSNDLTDVREVKDVKISLDGQLIAVSYGKIGGLWDRKTMKLLRDIRGHDFIESLAFHPTGHAMLSAGSEGRIQSWEIQPCFDKLRKKGLSLVSQEPSTKE